MRKHKTAGERGQLVTSILDVLMHIEREEEAVERAARFIMGSPPAV